MHRYWRSGRKTLELIVEFPQNSRSQYILHISCGYLNTWGQYFSEDIIKSDIYGKILRGEDYA